MNVNFHLHYRTKQGERIAIKLRTNGQATVLACQTSDGQNWHTSMQVTEKEQFEYKYLLQAKEKTEQEQGEFRPLFLPKGQPRIFIQDHWRPTHEIEQAFFSAAFKEVVFRRKTAAAKAKTTARPKPVANNKIRFQLHAAAIAPHLCFCILGNNEALGNWENPILLSDRNYPVWQAEIEVAQNVRLDYKFAIFDPAAQRIVEWEEGPDRHLSFNFPAENGSALVRTDERFRYLSGLWRGAGVAVPVFSLRSKNSLGIGEFTDLKLLVDWAVKTGLKMVQTLPVNDTIGTKTWRDSYPYRAISVFALHPLYVNIQAIAKLKNKKATARLKEFTSALNMLEKVDFKQVMMTKFEFLYLLFEQEKTAFLKNKAAQKFIEENSGWLKPYAAFCHLRDLYGTADFTAWKKHPVYSRQTIDQLCSPNSEVFDRIAFYYFIQFHAHQQLLGAADYARQNGVVLKGDLPIGIARHSCDAWVAPELYNMDGQAGAPPDAFSEEGQNWGFPTYNWEEMAKDNFAWWRKRMTKLAEYFDALRIDHILGFFRIWEIPTNQVIGTMGLFNPRLPYSLGELARFGVHGNLDRFTKPYIREHFLGKMFGREVGFVRSVFLNEVGAGIFELKEFAGSQLKIKRLFEKGGKFHHQKEVGKKLMQLVSEVLLIEEPGSGGKSFNPRITLTATRSFRELSKPEQHDFERLYNEYHFNRHNEFWRKKALLKLPALLQATNMLICGEDLGMIPASVAGVMEQLSILTLEIQRMPKGRAEFGEPGGYPYASVCSPSCHDMPTIRGWWEADSGRAKRFFKNQLSQEGTAPQECTPEMVAAFVRQHLESPSMWAVFPLQDLLGMDGGLRHGTASAEQINEPNNPDHYWRFRVHLPLEKLLESDGLNRRIESMVSSAGR